MLADQTRPSVAQLAVLPWGWHGCASRPAASRAVPSNGCTNPGAMIFLWRVHGLVAAGSPWSGARCPVLNCAVVGVVAERGVGCADLEPVGTDQVVG